MSSEGIEGETAEFGKGFVGDDDVSGVVDRGAVGRLAEGEAVALRGGGFHGGVGFDEEAIEGNDAEIFETGGVAGGEPLDVEREISAEVGEGFDQLSRAAVAVQQETGGGKARGGAKDVEGGAVGLGGVDRGRAVQLGGKIELRGEDFDLFGERSDAEAGDAGIVGADTVDDPAVEADFTDPGARIGEERGAEEAEPVGCALAAVPGVDAVAGDELEWRVGSGELGAERGDEGEFVFVGGVDDDGADAGAYQIGDDGRVVRDEGVELKVEMSVVEVRHRKEEVPTEHSEDSEGGGTGRLWAVRTCASGRRRG